MKFKKIILSFVLICISIFSFIGCAKIEFMRTVDGANAVVDWLVIELDEKKIEQAGERVSHIYGMINSDMQTIVQKVKDWKLTFEKYEDLYPAINEGIEAKVTENKQDNKLTLSISFANVQLFGLFYGYVESDKYEYEKMMEDVGPFVEQMLKEEYSPNENYGLFLYKYSLIKDDGILSSIEDFTFGGTNYYNKYKEEMRIYDIQDVEISEIFTFPDNRLYSNADDKEKVEGLTLLRWDLTGKDVENFSIEIYKLAPRTVSWYILAFVITIIFIVVMSIVIYKKRKKSIDVKISKRDVMKDGK